MDEEINRVCPFRIRTIKEDRFEGDTHKIIKYKEFSHCYGTACPHYREDSELYWCDIADKISDIDMRG